MSKQGNTLKSIFEQSGLKADDFAKAIGVSRTHLYNLFKEDTLPVKYFKAMQRIDYDTKQRDKRYPTAFSSMQVAEESPTPVYDLTATAGDMEQNLELPELIKGYITLPSFKGCIAFLYVRGDSMYPKYKAGDLIGIVPVQDVEIIQYGQPYLIVTSDNQRMVKYIRKASNEGKLLLKSENEHYDTFEIDKSKITKLYMVKGPIRDDWQ